MLYSIKMKAHEKIKRTFFFLTCVCVCVCVCARAHARLSIYAPCAYKNHQEHKESDHPGTGVAESWESPCGCWEQNPSPPHECS